MKLVTMKEIAHKAGISQPAVSKILNNKESMVSQATREKVLQIARELNYRPNYFAKSLKAGRTNCIGLVGSLKMVDLSAYCYTKVAQAIEETLSYEKVNYSLVIFGANFTETYEKSLELIARGMVDGLILIILATDLDTFAGELRPRLVSLNMPFVVIHGTSQKLPYNNVGLDSHLAGYLAAEHLVFLGHKDLGFFMRDRNNPMIAETLAGFKQALADKGINWNDRMMIEPVVRTADFCYQTFKKLPHFPRAIFFPDDSDAYTAMTALHERGIRVPEEVAVMGFDDEKPARYFRTSLTSIHHPFEEKGREAVLMLAGILNGTLKSDVVHQKILKPHLAVRETCGEKTVNS